MLRLAQILTFATIVLVAMLISACGGADSSDPATGEATTATASGEDFVAEGVTFDVVQQSRSCTPEGLYVARISWTVPDEVPFVRVTVGEDERVFTEGRGPSGSARTGPWVRRGLVFALTESSGQGEVLARTRAAPGECGG